MAGSEVIDVGDMLFTTDMEHSVLLPPVDARQDGFPSFKEAKERFEREYVMKTLEMNRGNVSQAARLAQKDRKDFYAVMKKHNIDPDVYRGNG